MVSDLISRQNTVDTIRKQLNDTNALVDVIGWKGVDPIAPMIHLISAISALPSADRSTGKWIMHIDDLYPEESTQECSNCHKHETIFIRHDNYCPNCGARMKGEE